MQNSINPAKDWEAAVEEGHEANRTQNYADAEAAFRRALAIAEGFGDHRLIESIETLGSFCRDRGAGPEAESLFTRSLGQRESKADDKQLSLIVPLIRLARLRRDIGKLEHAEKLYERALGIARSGRGEAHPETVLLSHNLAEFYFEQGRFEEASKLFIFVAGAAKTEGGFTAQLKEATASQRAAEALGRLGRNAEAEPFLRRAAELKTQEAKQTVLRDVAPA